MNLREELFLMQDAKYRDFCIKLIPNISPESVIGVRIPILRALAKELWSRGQYREFLDDLPHKYLEENHLHSFLISQIKDFDSCALELERFLPYVDNWSVCDSLRPRCIDKWLESDKVYTRRFAIEMLMVHFLDEDFSYEHLDRVVGAEGEDYYLKMMVAWYFATALAKQYEATLPYISNRVISDKWTHNKAIQKACESLRISDEKKMLLKKLKY